MRPRERQGLGPGMTAWNRASAMPSSFTNLLNYDDSEKYTLLCETTEIFCLIQLFLD